MANGKRRKKIIYSLDDNGVLVEGTENILKLATSCYKELFGPAPRNMFPIATDLWDESEKLSSMDNDILTRLFSEEEVGKLWPMIN